MISLRQLLIVLGCLFVTGTSLAQTRDDGYVAASDQFNQLLSGSGGAPKMPRLTDKKGGKLIAIMSDTKRFVHSQKFTQKDMSYLLDMCDRANNVVMAYVLFDGRRNVKPGSKREDVTKQVVKNMNENVLAYQSEIELLMPFLLHCVASEIPLLTAFVEKLKPEELTNIRRDGLNKMRRGLFRTYSGFIEMIGNPKARRSLRETVFAALAETSPQFSTVFSMVDRTQVLRLLKSLDPKQPKVVRSAVDKIRTSMENKECLALCKF